MSSSNSTHLIRWEFENMTNCVVNGPAKESPITNIAGLSWKIRIVTERSVRTGNVARFGIFLHCSNPNAKGFWKCENQHKIKIVNRRDDAKSHRTNLLTKPYHHDTDGFGLGIFFGLDFAKLMDDQEGFLHDDKLIVEVSLTIRRTIGVKMNTRLNDFAEPDQTSDVCLIVEYKRIYASKAVLSTISPVFKAMLYGKFEEGGKREIELQDIKHKDFMAFLNVVYSSLHSIEEDSVEGILAVADRFNAKIVLEAVKPFFLGNSKMHIGKKLLLTDTYRMDVTQLSEWYVSYSDKLKARICDRMMEIMGDS